MSFKVRTLYSVDYDQQTETIQGEEFWNLYTLQQPSSADGMKQSPYNVTAFPYTQITPYWSGPNVYTDVVDARYDYTYDGSIYGNITSDLTDSNYWTTQGYYLNSTGTAYMTRSGTPYQLMCFFWDPGTLSYRQVLISHKLVDEFSVTTVYHPLTSSTSYTYNGYLVHTNGVPRSSQYSGWTYPHCKVASLYLNYLDDSSLDRYICQDTLSFVHREEDPTDQDSSYTEGYILSGDPFATILGMKTGQSNNFVDYDFTSNTGGTSKLWFAINGIHKNVDDPNGSWVGELQFGIQNKPLYCRSFSGNPDNVRRFYQTKGCVISDSGVPVDLVGDYITLPKSYGPFGNWLVRLGGRYASPASICPIQQRLFNVTKQTDFVFDGI